MHGHDSHSGHRGNSVEAVLRMTPERPKAKQPTKLQVRFREGDAPAQLEESHERLVHMIIVSESFDTFAHIHPEDLGITNEMRRDATYELAYEFAHGGRHLVAVDFMHNGEHQSRQFVVEIDGPPTQRAEDSSLSRTFGDYAVRLAVTQADAGQMTLEYTITRGGSPVTDLEQYLAAPMHIAAIKEDFSAFAHAHGEVPSEQHEPGQHSAEHQHSPGQQHHSHHHMEVPERFGPRVLCAIDFPTAGRYHVFGEFKHQGKVVATHFILDLPRTTV